MINPAELRTPAQIVEELNENTQTVISNPESFGKKGSQKFITAAIVKAVKELRNHSGIALQMIGEGRVIKLVPIVGVLEMQSAYTPNELLDDGLVTEDTTEEFLEQSADSENGPDPVVQLLYCTLIENLERFEKFDLV